MIRAIVIMGPSGNGKSTLARSLAGELGWEFIEGDDHHPPENIAKMARGEPLTDSDRAPFLDGVGRALANASRGAVASCSALRRAYRDRLRGLAGPILFVWPRLSHDQLAARMKARERHFMPPSLLDSQLATLEPPGPDEAVLEIDGSLSVTAQVARVRQYLENEAPSH